jgi:hypothetical protein
MPESQRDPVRPTRRALDDLGLKFPHLERQLHRLDHPVVVRAQKIPAEVSAQGAERVVAIDDLVWFKVKTGVHRAAVHKLDSATERRPEIRDGNAWWWLGAAGTRKADSGTDDFYSRLTLECEREGKGTGRVSSVHLLPGEWDAKRLHAELAAQFTLGIKDLVGRIAANSIRDGRMWSATIQKYKISVSVRAPGGDAYIAVIAEGFVDPQFLAVVLASVPGVNSDDWLPEPEGALGIKPGFGKIIFSAIVLPERQAEIVVKYPARWSSE